MGARQREKSDMTRAELSEAMAALFIEKGYENTSVKEITERVGYSVGSFYRHWRSKEQAFMDCCNAYVSGFIRESVENAPRAGGAREMVDYLVARSELFSKDSKTIKLYAASRAIGNVYADRDVADWAGQYTRLIADFLRRATGCEDARRLTTVANIFHSVLDTHALQYTDFVSPHFDIDSATLRECLLALADQLKNA